MNRNYDYVLQQNTTDCGIASIMTVLMYYGIKPSREINPDEAVAIGAAIQANIDNIAKPMKISDVCARSLGIVWYDKKNNREYEIINYYQLSLLGRINKFILID